MTLTAVANGAYRTCTAPCMTTILLRDQSNLTTDDTTSSVFPDYTHDILWVGGALGWLHKITGVFRGTPAEVTTGGFPVHSDCGHTPSPAPCTTIPRAMSLWAITADFSIASAPPEWSPNQARWILEPVWSQGPSWTRRAGKVYVFSSERRHQSLRRIPPHAQRFTCSTPVSPPDAIGTRRYRRNQPSCAPQSQSAV